MEHQIITPAAGTPALPPAMLDTLAQKGLQSLLFAPIPKVARALAGFDRDQLGTAIEIMIAMLDAADGDPDVEADDRGGETIALMADPDVPPETGEDPDLEQTRDEDDWYAHAADGPGCPIADAGGGAADDEGEPDGTDEGDPSWTEWHTRGRQKIDPHGAEQCRQKSGNMDHEDEEEDDDSGQCTEDEISCGDSDFGRQGAGCTISDPDYAIDDVGCDETHQDLEIEQMIDDVPSLPVHTLDHNVFNDQRVLLGISNLMDSFVGQRVLSADTGAVHDRYPERYKGKPGAPV